MQSWLPTNRMTAPSKCFRNLDFEHSNTTTLRRPLPTRKISSQAPFLVSCAEARCLLHDPTLDTGTSVFARSVFGMFASQHNQSGGTLALPLIPNKIRKRQRTELKNFEGFGGKGSLHTKSLNTVKTSMLLTPDTIKSSPTPNLHLSLNTFRFPVIILSPYLEMFQAPEGGYKFINGRGEEQDADAYIRAQELKLAEEANEKKEQQQDPLFGPRSPPTSEEDSD